MLWNDQQIFTGNYLVLEPGFQVSLVLRGHALVLLADLTDESGQVDLWFGVYLYVDLSSHL